MLHIGDTVKDLVTGKLHKVAAIYAGHAVADGLRDANDQISIPITAGTQDIVHTDLFTVTLCGHMLPAAKPSDYATVLLESYARNYGAADSALSSIARVLNMLPADDGKPRVSVLVERLHQLRDCVETYLQYCVPCPNADGTERSPHIVDFPTIIR